MKQLIETVGTSGLEPFKSSTQRFVSAKASSHSRPKIGHGAAVQGLRCKAMRIAEVDCPVVRSTVKSRHGASDWDKSLWPITSPVTASVVVTNGKPPVANGRTYLIRAAKNSSRWVTTAK